MSKNLYYDDVKIIKKPLSAKLKLAFKFFLIILTFVACGFISVYLSDALTVGNISSLFVYGNKSIKTKETSLYAVTLGEYDTALEAERVGYGANIQGASGYVWEDEKFWVIGNIYSSISDAEKVVENLKDSKYNIEIKEIVFPKLALEFDDYENKDVSQIKEVFDLFDKVYENLYDYSIKYDKGEMNNLAISSEVSNMRGESKVLISKIQNLLSVKNDDLQIIQNNLIRLDELLNQTIIKAIDDTGTNYTLKNSISTAIRIKYEMYYALVK